MDTVGGVTRRLVVKANLHASLPQSTLYNLARAIKAESRTNEQKSEQVSIGRPRQMIGAHSQI